jgi:hypothetical protein
MTLRQLVEYYKRVVRISAALGTPTDLEVKHITQAWIELCKMIAKREGVPAGFVNYFGTELARSEMRVLELAEEVTDAYS